MPTLIFDIETVGEQWDELDETTQESLTRWIERSARNEEERDARIADIKQGLGFSPLTGSVVSIAVYDRERSQGAVYYRGEGNEEEYTADGFIYKQRDEAAMLEDFWEGARSYQIFVTFNGRAFDVPFLVHRSLAHGVTPSVNLVGRRYLSQQKVLYHVDLQDELTFYGAMQRRPNLHLFCRAYGIESPKQGVGGDDVAALFEGGAYQTIAEYNAADVVATTALYERWLAHLAPPWFRADASTHYVQ